MPPVPKKPDDGTLEITHDERDKDKNTGSGEAITGAGMSAPTPSSLPEPAEDHEHEDHDNGGFIPTENPSGPPLPGALTPPFEPIPKPPETVGPKAPDIMPLTLTPPQPPASLQPSASGEQPVSGPEPQVVAPQIHIDEHGQLSPLGEGGNEELDESMLPPAKHDAPTISHHNEAPKMVLEPPTMGGEMAASAAPGGGFGASGNDEDSGLPGMPQHDMPLLGAATANSPAPSPAGMLPVTEPEPQNAPGTSFLGDQPLMPANNEPKPGIPGPNETLSDIEKDVHSSHVGAPTASMTLSEGSTSPSAMPNDAALAPPPADPASQIPVVGPNDLTPDDIARAFNVPDNEPSAQNHGSEASSDEAGSSLDQARDAVAQAIGSDPNATATDPLQALNANPLADPNAATATVPADAGPTDSSAVQYPATPVQPWTPPADNAVPQSGAALPPAPAAPPPMMPNM